MNPNELLLRDIHLPAPVSWWPPAPGWWLLVATLLGGSLALWWWRRCRIARRSAPAALARLELTRLQAEWQRDRDSQQLLRKISIWLRRVSMSLSSRQQTASLTGRQWQQRLDELAGEAVFSAADAELITTAPYRASLPDDAVDGARLLALCERWLEAAKRRVARR